MKTAGRYHHQKMMQSNNLIALLCLSFLVCADKPTQPELTEEDVARIVAEELAKMADVEKEEETALTPQEIAEIAIAPRPLSNRPPHLPIELPILQVHQQYHL